MTIKMYGVMFELLNVICLKLGYLRQRIIHVSLKLFVLLLRLFYLLRFLKFDAGC
jgi:hypothetical protein